MYREDTVSKSAFLVAQKCKDCGLCGKRYGINAKLWYCAFNVAMVSPNGPICTAFECRDPIQTIGAVIYTSRRKTK